MGADQPGRLAVHSGPLPANLIGATFVQHRPDVAPTRVGESGLTLVIPTSQWEEGRVVGRLEVAPISSQERAANDQPGLMQLAEGDATEGETRPARGGEASANESDEVS